MKHNSSGYFKIGQHVILSVGIPKDDDVTVVRAGTKGVVTDTYWSAPGYDSRVLVQFANKNHSLAIEENVLIHDPAFNDSITKEQYDELSKKANRLEVIDESNICLTVESQLRLDLLKIYDGDVGAARSAYKWVSGHDIEG